jgi:outer membrane lipoprotein LolB
MRSNELDHVLLKHAHPVTPRWRHACILALSLLAAACTTTPTVTQTQLQHSRSYANTATIDGRLSIRYEASGGEQASHGSFNWVQHDKRTTVQLLSPLGQVVAVITMTPGQSTLTQANRPAKTAADPDSLIHDVIGWPLPINGLQDWLQGFHTDRAGKRIPIQAANEPVTITTTDGWRLTYGAWEPDSNNALRPKRIDATRNTKEAGTVAIRIVIDAWQTR